MPAHFRGEAFGLPSHPELRHMVGDTVVVRWLDRLARSNRDLLGLAETIVAAEARFESLSDPRPRLRHRPA